MKKTQPPAKNTSWDKSITNESMKNDILLASTRQTLSAPETASQQPAQYLSNYSFTQHLAQVHLCLIANTSFSKIFMFLQSTFIP